jgi:2-polyprenyl-6-methoxyphenol hydroxylase-like FAD-dependent oxidoreductase
MSGALEKGGWVGGQAFGRGRVTLVGDAWHAGPTNGQGLNLTMEDAAVLAFHVQEGGLNPASLRRQANLVTCHSPFFTNAAKAWV